MSDNQDKNHDNDVASEVLEHLKNPPVEVINPKNKPGSSKKKYLLLTSILIIIFSVLGFAIWYFVLNKKDQPENTQATMASQEQPESESGDDNLTSDELSQEYTSDRLQIDVKHPSNWKVDESSGEIIVYSPKTDVENVGGSEVSAEFRVIIKQGSGSSDSKYLGRGFAVKESQKIEYIDPAANQREESLVTNFGLDSSDSFAYFVVQGNFDLKKNETLGSDFASEADAVLVSGGFYSNESEDETKLVELDLDKYESNELYQTAIDIVKTLRLR